MAIKLPTGSYSRLYRIALIIAFIQFTNALEYMMFNPIFKFMAPDFAVPVTWAGYVTGAYTFAAVFSGIAAFYWVDKVDKKRFLLFNMLALGILTLLITLTPQFTVLVIVRLLAGLAGGTTMGVGIGLLINAATPELRPRMVALVITSFSVVSIVGMPALLYICSTYGWRWALWIISLFCLLSALLIHIGIPCAEAHKEHHTRLKLNGEVLSFACGNGIAQFSPMLLIPVLVPILGQYLQVTNDRLPWVFFSGGIAGFLATKATGRLLHQFTAVRILWVSTALFMVSLLIPYFLPSAPYLFMTLFMAAAYCRLVATSVLTLNYPLDHHRAGFGTLQTALMYLLTTLAYFLSSILTSGAEITAQSLSHIMWICGLSAAVAPGYCYFLQRRLRLK